MVTFDRRTSARESTRKGTARSYRPRSLDDLLESYERRVITETLKRHDCNVAKASEALGSGIEADVI